jgi:predicted  nucleic acid-binding Zn-ribbon protein
MYEYLPKDEQLGLIEDALERLERRHMQEVMRTETVPEDTTVNVAIGRIEQKLEELRHQRDKLREELDSDDT